MVPLTRSEKNALKLGRYPGDVRRRGIGRGGDNFYLSFLKALWAKRLSGLRPLVTSSIEPFYGCSARILYVSRH